MKSFIDTYPVFEANQVLSNSHLNQIFDYLDEQGRLTRANLVGIGIVCGLEVQVDTTANTVRVSRGCGVTSQGYLIVEAEELNLVAYRAYTLPLELDYPAFRNSGTQYPLWELFPVGEPDTTPLGDTAGFLEDKTALLFLELRKESLANCSPNNCDDKGAEVVATVRPLLLSTGDLVRIIGEANKLGSGLTQADLTSALDARLDLPDLRLPRFDVQNTRPTSSENVLDAFLNVFKRNGLVAETHRALTAAYTTFAPVLHDAYSSDPFGSFDTQFGFLDNAPADATQVAFLQYYYDFFDDLYGAYEEFRKRGAELLCACCPPEGLFPRHLVLGPQFRQLFLRSAAISDCDERTHDLVVLFTRMVEMTRRFTNVPVLPPQPKKSATDAQIRITPSSLAAVPLSEKAIPYYYQLNGNPPLHELWNPDRTHRRRSNQNLGYRSSEYSPAAPAFVTQPLAYDLEPYNFLRIEGHLGKHYQRVLMTLLSLRARYRLPIDVIALRTGDFNEAITVDLAMTDCHFRDLDTLYDALRDELLCSIDKLIRTYAAKPLQRDPRFVTRSATVLNADTTGSIAAVGVEATRADEFVRLFLPKPNTVGAYVEARMRTAIGDDLMVAGEAPLVNAVVNTVGLLHQFRTLLQKELSELDWNSFKAFYEQLKEWSNGVTAQHNNMEAEGEISWRDLDAQLASVIYACRLDAFKSLLEEFTRRVREVKQNQFLNYFLEKNPGIQHKAGVPVGGTFILVHHHADTPLTRPPTGGAVTTGLKPPTTTAAAVQRAVKNLTGKPQFAGEKNIQTLVASLEQLLQLDPALFEAARALDERVLTAAVNDLPDGTVIADFFVPYLCCSDCASLQYVLPTPVVEVPPDPLTFGTSLGCTSAKGRADLTVAARGGMAPYQVAVDGKAAAPLAGAIPLTTGVHSIVVQDAADVRTPPQSITVPAALASGEIVFDEISRFQFTASFRVTGGTAPYSTNMGQLALDNTVVVGPINSGETRTVDVTDSVGCRISTVISHVIERPVDPLSFTTTMGCTNVDGEAQVVIAPVGGVPPFEAQIDGAQFVRIERPIPLAAGKRSIVVRDAAGTVTRSQSVTVPPTLKLGSVEFTDNTAAAVYDAVIPVSGGTPPYVTDRGEGGGNSVRLRALPSGQPVSVVVSDAIGCSVSTEISHVVPRNCDKPCDGLATRCRYVVWMEKPGERDSYRYSEIGPVVLEVFDAAGNKRFSQDLSPVFSELLIGQVVNAGAYDELLRKIVDIVNRRLSTVLGPDTVLFGYSSDDPGLFTVEHYRCHSFVFSIAFTVFSGDERKSERWNYTNDGATVSQIAPRSDDYKLRRFGCVELDKCATQPVIKSDCRLQLRVVSERIGNKGAAFQAAFTARATEPIAFLWRIDGSNFLSSTEPSVSVLFGDGPDIRVHVVVIDANGCWGFGAAVVTKPVGGQP